MISTHLHGWQKNINNVINGGVLKKHPHLDAKCWRYLGEIEEVIGDICKAIEYYKKAIQLDDSVGCKRRLNKLIK